MLKITLKLDERYDYTGTLFDGLEVSVSDGGSEQPLHDQFASLMDSLGGPAMGSPEMPAAYVHRTYWFHDRRYNPLHKTWELNDLIAELDLAASFGPLVEKQKEEHASFFIERERPEDHVLRVQNGGVRLKDWSVEPIYRFGQFASLQPAIQALKDVQTYLTAEGL